MKIKIRKLTVEDSNILSKLDKDIFEKESWSQSSFYFSLDSEFTTGICVEVEEKIVGYMIFSRFFDEANLDSIAVVKEFRRMGIARKLMDIFMDSCLQKKCKNIMLEVRIDNIQAINMYESYGFEILTTRKNYYGNGMDAFIMCRFG